MKYKLTLILSLAVIALQAQTPAFPGAEGFGKYAQGGRGGKVATVTSLGDYTSNETPVEGTLRWALEQYKHTEEIDGKTITVYEPLTIVFNVAGNIVLKEDLKVKRDYLTIAGQSAPGDGICITGHSMLFNGATGGEMWYWGPRRTDIIVRCLRFRPAVPTDKTYVTYGTDVENYENVIFDHCTMTWANEECLAFYDTKNTTVQYCLVAEGLYNANHKKGLRSYCGVWGGQFATYHHNLIAHQNSRAVRFNGARSHDTIAVIDYRNNVVYNWGNNGANAEGLEVEVLVEGVTRNELNMVNNYYKHGPASGYTENAEPKKGNKVNRFVINRQDKASVDSGYAGQHYITGNYLTNFPDITADNWWCGVQYKSAPYSSDTALARATFQAADFSPEVKSVQPADEETAEEAYEIVLENVGARFPKQDMQDARIIKETREGTASGMGSLKLAGIIDHPDAVGGWPELTGEPYTDTDADGIPDNWETRHGLNPADPADGALITASGYSNLEIYLNSLVLMPGEEPVDALPAISATHEAGEYVILGGRLYIQKAGILYTLSGQQVK